MGMDIHITNMVKWSTTASSVHT